MKNILNIFQKFYTGIIAVLIIVLSWFQLELSSGHTSWQQCFQMDIKYILLNIFTCAAIFIVFFLIFRKSWLSGLLFSLLSSVVSIVNHYTIKFHGMPLTVSALKNFRTALNVIHAYKIELDIRVLTICLILVITILLCFITRILKKNTKNQHILLRDCILIMSCSMIIYFGYASSYPIKPKETIGWSWVEAYHQYGYLACTIENILQSRNVVKMPDGFSEDKLENLKIAKNNDNSAPYVKPDIILVLNESFYDLSQLTNLETDIPYLENIDNMPNTIRGYSVVPGIGGGTNSSEYELLTSNSLQIMKGITPFNVLDMKNSNSIVSVLTQLGYQTLGAHSEPAVNYARGKAYPDMGFHKVYFDDDFKDKDYVGKRWFETDESLYNNLINWYGEMSEDPPKFMYLLTIQNHGGWDMNPPELDTVHAKNNFGDYQEEVNEFLTGIRLSDIAFKKLTEYFENIERPVVICMVGDHAPSFANKIIDGNYSDSEKKKRLRSTPFVIWSNYSQEKQDVGVISMNYLMPLLLDSANVELTPYYQYQLNIKKELPILTSYDVYYDNDGNEYTYNDNSVYSDMVNTYFYLEYENLKVKRMQEFYDIPGQKP